jgi:long-chain acyl-CoA synthetase
MGSEITRIFDLIPRYNERFPKADAFAGKDEGEWVRYSSKAYQDISNYISYGFLSLGVEKGDKIATITYNRPEWNFLDMGIMQVGAVHVPIYPTISESDYKYILAHSEVKYVFVAGEDLLRKIERMMPDIPTLKDIYTFKNLRGFRHLNELIRLGWQNPVPEKLEKIKQSIQTGDVATMIYTSGTTGNPKGVMLSHANIISNFVAVSPIPPMGSEARAVSYLPLCHVYERMMNYMYQYLGISVYYAESLATIGENVKEIQPEMFTTVPRLLEKIYEKILQKGRKLPGLKKKIFFWALDIGFRYNVGESNGFWYGIQLKLANMLVFKKWREALGNNIKIIVSGGAALQPRLCRIFWAARIPVLEGYGLTETSPVIAVSNLWKNGVKCGTVGPVLPGVEVKIADDGEVLVKGPGIMVGYYKEPELTRDAIDADGWFHTGDTGIIEEKGQLRLTGRKKEIFKTSFGKYVNPGAIEDLFKESPFIDNMAVFGENQKFAVALVVPDFNDLRNWCANKGIDYTTNTEMVNNDRIRQRYRKEMNKYNAMLGATEQIKRWELIDFEWSTFTGELTPTLKLKRNYIAKKYADVIERLFKAGDTGGL